jgi:hypothetical protein
VAGNELRPCLGELVRYGDCLLRIAGVVAHFKLQLFTKDTTSGVDIRDGLLGALSELLAKARFGTRHRSCDADNDLGVGGGGGKCGCCNGSQKGKLERHDVGRSQNEVFS